MAFVSAVRGCGDTNWGASARTIQDLEADSTGNTVYAEGTVTWRKYGKVIGTQTLNNRGYSTVNGKPIYNPPFYSIAESQQCLTQILLQLANIGKSNA